MTDRDFLLIILSQIEQFELVCGVIACVGFLQNLFIRANWITLKMHGFEAESFSFLLLFLVLSLKKVIDRNPKCGKEIVLVELEVFHRF